MGQMKYVTIVLKVKTDIYQNHLEQLTTKGNMKNLKISTDDNKAMTSELEVSICKPTNVLRFEHKMQYSGTNIFYVYPSDIDNLCEYLKTAKKYIESGYKNKV